MAYSYTCDICGLELDSESEDGLVQLAKQHFKAEHGKRREKDIVKPDIVDKEEELRDRIEETEE